MYSDDFGFFGGGFDPFDGGTSQPAFEEHVFDGYFDDAHTQAVDPYLESYNLATSDPTAIGIRLQREQTEQSVRMEQDALDHALAIENWVACVVSGEVPSDDDCFQDIDNRVRGWELAERLSASLAKQLGFEGERDDDCWMRPTREEWRHLPTDYMRIYNDAYARFAKLIGKKLPVDSAMTAEQWDQAVDHEAMAVALAGLVTEPAPARRRLRIIRTQPY